MSSDLLSILWPPTLLTGIVAIVFTLFIARLYPYWRTRFVFKGNATIKFNEESFFMRTIATGISISSILVQASSLQPLSLLSGTGGGQLYITFSLLILLGILFSNLKQKLDSFVITTQPSRPTLLSGVQRTKSLEQVSEEEFAPNDKMWAILEVAKGTLADLTSTVAIAGETGRQSSEVYEDCLILKDHNYLTFTESLGMALVRITGKGLQALRTRQKFESSD